MATDTTQPSLTAGVGAPGRATIAWRTLRKDPWWLQPGITAFVLFSFVVYATWRAFENAYYFSSPVHFAVLLALPCIELSRRVE